MRLVSLILLILSLLPIGIAEFKAYNSGGFGFAAGAWMIYFLVIPMPLFLLFLELSNFKLI